MSTKKDKLLESAQKFITKGQIDKAIKDYEQVVALDAKDIRSRQRYAELLVRANRKKDAIAEYVAIGTYYVENTHYLKAIAVYKQIQKLEPENIQTSLTLATLNEKQGLPGNALAEYEQILAMYQKEQQWAEALKIVEKMLAVDPENLNTRLKQAELEFSAKQLDQSYSSFLSLLVTLEKRNEPSATRQINERIHALFPGRSDLEVDLAGVLIEAGHAAEAVGKLKEFLRNDQNSLKAWLFLASAENAVGQHEECRKIYHQMLRLFPQERSVVEEFVQFSISRGDIEGAASVLPAHAIHFLASGAALDLEKLYNSLLALSPLDLRILNGLREVYAATRDEQMLQIVEEKIRSLDVVKPSAPAPTENAASVAAIPEPEEEVPAPAEDIPSPDESVSMDDLELDLGDIPELAEDVEDSEPGAPPSAGLQLQEPPEGGQDTEWEEDLDLSFLDDAADEISLDLPEEVHDVAVAASKVTLAEGPKEPVIDVNAAPVSISSSPGNEDVADPSAAGHEEEFPTGLDVDFSHLAESSIPDDLADLDVDVADSALFEAEEVELLDLEEIDDLEPELDQSIPFPDVVSHSALLNHEDSSGQGYERIRLEEKPEEEDPETHYNLGIAYKEMGLYDEAIQELRKAQTSSSYRFSCTTLVALCYRDKGEPDQAEEVYLRGMDQAEEGAEKVSLMHELGFLYETCGRNDDAIALYRRVAVIDPSFPDIQDKIARLEGGDAIDLDDSEIMELDHEDFV